MDDCASILDGMTIKTSTHSASLQYVVKVHVHCIQGAFICVLIMHMYKYYILELHS